MKMSKTLMLLFAVQAFSIALAVYSTDHVLLLSGLFVYAMTVFALAIYVRKFALKVEAPAILALSSIITCFGALVGYAVSLQYHSALTALGVSTVSIVYAVLAVKLRVIAS